MPWVNPKVDLTEDEYDAFVDRCLENGDEDLLDEDSVWIDPCDMFDHTGGEIDEMEEEDDENGILMGSQHWRE